MKAGESNTHRNTHTPTHTGRLIRGWGRACREEEKEEKLMKQPPPPASPKDWDAPRVRQTQRQHG